MRKLEQHLGRCPTHWVFLTLRVIGILSSVVTFGLVCTFRSHPERLEGLPNHPEFQIIAKNTRWHQGQRVVVGFSIATGVVTFISLLIDGLYGGLHFILVHTAWDRPYLLTIIGILADLSVSSASGYLAYLFSQPVLGISFLTCKCDAYSMVVPDEILSHNLTLEGFFQAKDIHDTINDLCLSYQISAIMMVCLW